MRRSALATLLGMAALCHSPANVHAQAGTGVVRVATSGSDAMGCGSLASPCQSLQFAVEQFAPESEGRLLIAAGTYVSTNLRQVVRITEGRNLIVEGGYTTAFDIADPDAQPVVIDGQNARRGVTVDPTPGFRDPQLTLAGVTLTRGLAPQELGVNTLSSFGGAIDVFQSTVALIDVKVIDNRALGLNASSGLPGDGSGGGVSLRQCTALLADVAIDDNLAEGGDGTGTAVRGGLGVGGGLFVFESAVTLNNVRANTNRAQGGDAPAAGGDSGGQRADGLGGFWALILSRGSASHLAASGNQAVGGQASDFAGLGLGGALFLEQSGAAVSILSSTLDDNLALGGVALGSTGGLGGGGAIFSTDGFLSLEASVLVGNRAEGGAGPTLGGDGAGGGIYLDSVLAGGGGLRASNSVVGANQVVAGAAATPGFAFGGGLFIQCPRGPGVCDGQSASNDVELTHVTLADNSVAGAQFNQGAALFASQAVSVSAAFGIVSGHTTPITADDRGEAVIAFADVTFDDTLWDGNTLKSFAVPPNGVFQDNAPRSGDPAYADPLATPADYHLTVGSAARDAAAGSTGKDDLDREARPFEPGMQAGVPDLGADEYYPTPDPRSFGTGLYASVFEDGRLLVLDPANGSATSLGSGPIDLAGLTSFDGRLFGLWGMGQLVELDPATGAALAVAQRAIGAGGEGGVTIDSSGAGFAAQGIPDADLLWSFALGAAAPSALANQGVAFDGLAADGGGNLFGLSDSLQLYAVDRNGAAPSLLGSTGLGAVGSAGLAFSPTGVLFAAVGDTLYELDTLSAAPLAVGAIGAGPFATGGVSGLVFVPEPGPTSAALAALIALAALRGRRRLSSSSAPASRARAGTATPRT